MNSLKYFIFATKLCHIICRFEMWVLHLSLFFTLMCLSHENPQTRIPPLLLSQLTSSRRILPSVRLQFTSHSPTPTRITANPENILEQEWGDFKVS